MYTKSNANTHTCFVGSSMRRAPQCGCTKTIYTKHTNTHTHIYACHDKIYAYIQGTWTHTRYMCKWRIHILQVYVYACAHAHICIWDGHTAINVCICACLPAYECICTHVYLRVRMWIPYTGVRVTHMSCTGVCVMRVCARVHVYRYVCLKPLHPDAYQCQRICMRRGWRGSNLIKQTNQCQYTRRGGGGESSSAGRGQRKGQMGGYGHTFTSYHQSHATSQHRRQRREKEETRRKAEEKEKGTYHRKGVREHKVEERRKKPYLQCGLWTWRRSARGPCAI